MKNPRPLLATATLGTTLGRRPAAGHSCSPAWQRPPRYCSWVAGTRGSSVLIVATPVDSWDRYKLLLQQGVDSTAW